MLVHKIQPVTSLLKKFEQFSVKYFDCSYIQSVLCTRLRNFPYFQTYLSMLCLLWGVNENR